MNFHFFRGEKRIGLDISAERMSLICLTKQNKRYRIDHAISESFSPLLPDHDLTTWWKIRQATLQKWVEKLKLQGRSVTISFPLHWVKIKELSLPIGLAHTDIEEAIKLEMQDDLHYMPNDLALDYAESTGHEPGYVTYTCALTRQSYLTPYIHCLHDVSLHLKIIDIDALALRRLIDFFYPVLSDAFLVVYVSEISASLNALILFHGEKIIAHQRLLFSSEDDIAVLLQQKIELILLAYLQLSIKQAIFCGQASLFSIIKKNGYFEDHIKLVYLNFSAYFHSSSLSADSFFKNPEYFLIASGLALREMPLW